MDIRVTRAKKIFSDGNHNAFTGITAFGSRVFVTFRSATNHMSPDGVIKVIASEDMLKWEPIAEAQRPERDLRDPKVVTFRDTLMVFAAACNRDLGIRCSVMCCSDDGVAFSDPVDLKGVPEGYWLWHMQPCGERLYGTAYCKKGNDNNVILCASEDGLNWQKINDFPIPGNETYIDFDHEGTLWALVRCDPNGSIPALCAARPPYSEFQTVKRLPMRLQGPMVKRLNNGCVIICRQKDLPGRRNLRTEVFWLEDDHEIQAIRSLPSGGDTSYAAWLDITSNTAVVSYYSSHEYKMDEPHANDSAFAQDPAHAEHSTPADIFLADISYM